MCEKCFEINTCCDLQIWSGYTLNWWFLIVFIVLRLEWRWSGWCLTLFEAKVDGVRSCYLWWWGVLIYVWEWCHTILIRMSQSYWIYSWLHQNLLVKPTSQSIWVLKWSLKTSELLKLSIRIQLNSTRKFPRLLF